MSVRLSDFAIQAEEWCQSSRSSPPPPKALSPNVSGEEDCWRPNPYEAEALEQVRKGEWPGLGCFDPMSPTGRISAEADVSTSADASSGPGKAGHDHGGPMWNLPAPSSKFPQVDAYDHSNSSVGYPTSSCYLSPPPELVTGRSASTFSGFGEEPVTPGGLGVQAYDSVSSSSATWRETSGNSRLQPQRDFLVQPTDHYSGAEGDDDVGGGSTAMEERHGDKSWRSTRKLCHRNVPKNLDFSKKLPDAVVQEGPQGQEFTTLMIRNIPNEYKRHMLIEELDSLGFKAEYDFIYLPIDRSTQRNVGYAFVNFKTSTGANQCMITMHNYAFSKFEHGSEKTAFVSLAHLQGLEQNLAYYKNTAVQASSVQAHRPLLIATKAANTTGTRRRLRKRGRRRAQKHAVAATEEEQRLEEGDEDQEELIGQDAGHDEDEDGGPLCGSSPETSSPSRQGRLGDEVSRSAADKGMFFQEEDDRDGQQTWSRGTSSRGETSRQRVCYRGSSSSCSQWDTCDEPSGYASVGASTESSLRRTKPVGKEEDALPAGAVPARPKVAATLASTAED